MNGKLLDKQVQEYLNIYWKKVVLPTKVVTVPTAKALIKRNNLQHLKDLDLEDSSWVKSLFKRMSFVKRAATTGRPGISEGAEKKLKFFSFIK